MTDGELFRLLERSPDEGRRALFDRCCAYVYAIAAEKLRSCGSREDIEECVSDIFAEIFICCDKGINESSGFKPLIAAIAKRTEIDFFRRLSVRSGRDVPIEEAYDIPANGADITSAAERNELRRIIREQVEQLGEPDCTIISQQYFSGLTVREIAQKLSMTEAAVQKRSIRARKRLKRSLEKAGITDIPD